MEHKHLVIFIGVLAILIILFFALNKGNQAPATSVSTTTHDITGLDGIIGSIQPGVLAGLGGGVATSGILGLLGGTGQQSNAGTSGTGIGASGDSSGQPTVGYDTNGNPVK